MSLQSLAGPTAMLAPTLALLAAAVSITSLLRRTMDGAAARGGGPGHWVFLAMHAPGNVFHELAHAAGFLAAGYRVERVRFFFNDDRGGAGYCRSGRPWAPWANRFLGALLAAPAPLILGSLLFAAILGAMGVDPGRLVADGLPGRWADVGPHLTQRALVLGDLARQVDLSDWRAWTLVGLAFLLGAHMLPSGTDLAGIAAALGTLFALVWLSGIASDRGPGWAGDAGAAVDGAATWMLARANALMAIGIACCAAALVASVPLALVARAGRARSRRP